MGVWYEHSPCSRVADRRLQVGLQPQTQPLKVRHLDSAMHGGALLL